jgi:hypothetical protein
MVYWIVLAGAVEECGDFTFTLTSLHAPPKGWRSPAPALPRIPSAPTPRIAAAAAAAKNSPPVRQPQRKRVSEALVETSTLVREGVRQELQQLNCLHHVLRC